VPEWFRRQVGALPYHIIERVLTLAIDLSSALRKETRLRTSFLSFTSPFLVFWTPSTKVTQARRCENGLAYNVGVSKG
jgi:hypothetical protein